MKLFLLYDEKTGRCKGRMTAPDNVAEHLGTYLEPEQDDFTMEEWQLQPERWWKVDPQTKTLVDLTDDELRVVQGIASGAQIPQRPTLSQRGRD